MKISVDPNTGDAKVSPLSKDDALRDQDLEDAKHIRTMMASKGWKALIKYEEVGKQSILDAGMMGIRNEETRKLSDMKFAILKGWTENSNLAERIVARADAYIEDKKEKENENDGSDTDEL